MGTAIPPGGTDPGRVAMRRLNRTEYNNTVRDLLGTKLRPADAFEADRSALGFDNNGDVQTLSPLQVEQYQSAAEALVEEALLGGPAAIAAIGRTAACDLTEGAPCLQRLVAAFARRAWRRPATMAETARLVALASEAAARGEDALGQLAVPLTAVLSSPHFLFRVELDPDPRSMAARPLNDHEIASRLSYLIYSSMPDDPLLSAADRGQLRTPEQVSAQTKRMLADPRAAALAGSFAAQWLDLRSLASHQVDEASFGKAFDRTLAALMEQETSRFFLEFLDGDLPIAGMLTARFTYLDARLARHYGLTAPGPTGLARVALTGDQRGGLLTHGSVLTATSPPNHSSPVARGAWVLSSLLCSPPPPPPANVPPLPEPSPTVAASMRARLEAHRMNPLCAACHLAMDPIGFGLEHFDGIGRWRTSDGPTSIDASGTLPDGSSFDGALELAALLARDPRLPGCLTQKLFTFALGRSPDADPSDRAYLERIAALSAGPEGVTMHRAIAALVTSDPFRLRRGEPATAGAGP
jgi:hypothetical protein